MLERTSSAHLYYMFSIRTQSLTACVHRVHCVSGLNPFIKYIWLNLLHGFEISIKSSSCRCCTRQLNYCVVVISCVIFITLNFSWCELLACIFKQDEYHNRSLLVTWKKEKEKNQVVQSFTYTGSRYLDAHKNVCVNVCPVMSEGFL